MATRFSVVGVLVATIASNAAALRPPCADGTFTVQGGPLLVGAPRHRSTR